MLRTIWIKNYNWWFKFYILGIQHTTSYWNTRQLLHWKANINLKVAFSIWVINYISNNNEWNNLSISLCIFWFKVSLRFSVCIQGTDITTPKFAMPFDGTLELCYSLNREKFLPETQDFGDQNKLADKFSMHIQSLAAKIFYC